MPQMSPLNWLSLMITFILTLQIINSINHFNTNYKTNKNSMENKMKNPKNWKW